MYSEEKLNALKLLSYEAFEYVCEDCPRKGFCDGFESEDCLSSEYFGQFIGALYEAQGILYRAASEHSRKKIHELLINFYGDFYLEIRKKT